MEISKFTSLIDEVIKEKLSDLHISTDNPPYIRNKIGDMVGVKNYGIVTSHDMQIICDHILGKPFVERTIDASYAQ